MRYLILIIFLFILASCQQGQLSDKLQGKQLDLPDSTSSWYAKQFDFQYYNRIKVVQNDINLLDLKIDTSEFEIRIWSFGALYSPHSVYQIRSRDGRYNISKISFNSAFLTNDSNAVSRILDIHEKSISSVEFETFNYNQLGDLKSQGSLVNGEKFGCVDGTAQIIDLSSRTRYKYLFYMCPEFHITKDSTIRKANQFINNVVTYYSESQVWY